MGYNFWGPSYYTYSYYPSVSYYCSWGWGYDPWYNPWGYSYGYPYYGYGYYGNPYMNGYANGYNQGYWDGYYNGYYNSNYFNSYDNNSYYYGPRGTTGANSRQNSQPSLAHRYMDQIESENQVPVGSIASREELNNFVPQYINNTIRPAANSSTPGIANPNTTTKPGSAAPSNNTRPGVNTPAVGKPADDYYTPGERPVNINNGGNGKGFEQPANNNKPVNEKPVYEQPKPVYEQPKPVQERPKPQFEQPKQERPKPQPEPARETPRREQPRMEQPRQQAPSAPRNNPPAPSGPRKR
jgi:hypothetical protein